VAGADSATIEEVVRNVLLDEQADVLRAAVEAVCAELMRVGFGALCSLCAACLRAQRRVSRG
jgi:hypothetical protein